MNSNIINNNNICRSRKRKMKRNIRAFYHCVILVALSSILSLLPIVKMENGGAVTVLSLLPVLSIGVKFGYKWGMGSSIVFMALQIVQGVFVDEVFVSLQTTGAIIACVILDYFIPYSILGLTAFAMPERKKRPDAIKILATFAVLIFIAFLSHFISGMTVWGQWDDGFAGAFLHSLKYNGSYMGIEFALTITVSGLMLATRQFSGLITDR